MLRREVHHQQGGFTIIEFLIATAVFSLVLLICSLAIVHVGRLYYKGMITNRTQDTTRRIADELIGAIQFGPNGDTAITAGPVDQDDIDVYVTCIGNIRYTYSLNAVLSDSHGIDADNIARSRHVLWRDVHTGTCVPANLRLLVPSTVAGAQELLGKGMRLAVFDVPDDVRSVKIAVAYGDSPTLFTDGSFTICNGVNAGGQFCAVSTLQTNVTKRL